MDRKEQDGGSVPYPQMPFAEPHFGQPADCADMVNKYGTYNIQPTADTANTFPLIAHGLPRAWRERKIGKEDLETTEWE